MREMPFVRVRDNLFCVVMSGLLFTAGCAGTVG
jgi:hypothetical protein